MEIAHENEHIIAVGDQETVYTFDSVELSSLRIDGNAALVNTETLISADFRHFLKAEKEQVDIEFYQDAVKEENLIGSYHATLTQPGEEITASVKWTPAVSGKVRIIAKVNEIDGLFEEKQIEKTFDVCSVQSIKQVKELAENGQYTAIRGIVTSGSYDKEYPSGGLVQEGSSAIEVLGSYLPMGADIIVLGTVHKAGDTVRLYGYKVIELGSVDAIENGDGSITKIDKAGGRIEVHYNRNTIEKYIQEQVSGTEDSREIVLEPKTADLRHQELIIDAEAVRLLSERELKLKIPLNNFTITIPEAAIKADKPTAFKVKPAKQIATGVDKYKFAPKDKLTRGQFAAFIVRALDIDLNEYSGVFDDCTDGKWYTPYVEAAERSGLVNGTGHGTFNPDQYITREEMAVLAKRAYEYAADSRGNKA